MSGWDKCSHCERFVYFHDGAGCPACGTSLELDEDPRTVEIKAICKALEEAWLRTPEQRFGQMVEKLARGQYHQWNIWDILMRGFSGRKTMKRLEDEDDGYYTYCECGEAKFAGACPYCDPDDYERAIEEAGDVS